MARYALDGVAASACGWRSSLGWANGYAWGGRRVLGDAGGCGQWAKKKGEQHLCHSPVPRQADAARQLGKRKARCIPVRFLTLPVEHRACDFHRTRRSTFGRSPWISMKRLFPFLQLHGAFPVDSLRVRWVPLVPSFQRLGAFAISPHPGVPSFPGLRLLCPIRLL